MKIDYFFPIFKEDDTEGFLNNFKKTSFFLENKNFSFVFVVEKDDVNTIKFLSEQAKSCPEYKILIANKSFSYNDAFSLAIDGFTGDIVLLGDMKIAKLDLIFANCLSKKQKNASVVHVVKKQTGFRGFWKNLSAKIYNFFIKIFTSKKDRLNVVSLGLIDKNIIELLQVLPNKRCFIKNTKDLKGFETRTIYINPKTKTYKPNFKQKTTALKTFFISLSLFFVLLGLVIAVNKLLNVVPPIINIILVFLIFSSFILCSMILPKHFFDCRNKEFLNSKPDLQELVVKEEIKKTSIKKRTELKKTKNKNKTKKTSTKKVVERHKTTKQAKNLSTKTKTQTEKK